MNNKLKAILITLGIIVLLPALFLLFFQFLFIIASVLIFSVLVYVLYGTIHEYLEDN